jgi:membrane-associated phospholipid phosphatase
MSPLVHFARILSYLLHPLLMPFYTVLLILNLNTYLSFSTSPALQRIVLLVVFVTTLAFPLLTALIYLKKGTIRSLEMETAAERRLPFMTSAIYYLICFFLIDKLPVSRLLGAMVLAASVTIVIAWVLSYRYKVSIHMIGIGGLTGVLFALSGLLSADLTIPIIISFLIAGLLGTARLTLGAHSPSQIYSGFLIGFFTEWLLITGWS